MKLIDNNAGFLIGLLATMLVQTGQVLAHTQVPTGTYAPDNSPSFHITPAKSSFSVNEPIEFRLRSSKDVYLYLYSLNANGDYVLILPNYLQRHNKYLANTTVQVPNRSVAFYADGTVPVESIYAIASTSYIDLELAIQKQSGAFPIIDRRVMQHRFQSKGIGLRQLQTEAAVTQQFNHTHDTAYLEPLTLDPGLDATRQGLAPADASMIRIDVPITHTSTKQQ